MNRLTPLYAALRTRAPKQARALTNFAAIYLLDLSQRDIDCIAVHNMAQHVVAVYNFYAASRKDHAIRIQCHNPSYTHHSVIDIVLNDQPFLVDTVWNELQRRGLHIHYSIHPVLYTQRNAKGVVTHFSDDIPQQNSSNHAEALLHVEFDRTLDEKILRDIEIHIQRALKAAIAAVKDYSAITKRINQLIDTIEHTHSPTAQRHEYLALLQWLLADNFVFLGYRHYTITGSAATRSVIADKKSGLGILRNAPSSVEMATPLNKLKANLQNYYTNSADFLTLTKTLDKSLVHRYADMDYVGVKDVDNKGNVVGEHRFIGLYTSKAYTTGVRQIPVVGAKIKQVLSLQEADNAQTYYARKLTNILDTYPLDELLQIDINDLHRIATGIMHLQERQQVRLFVRKNRFEQIITALVFIPLERMNSQLRHKIQDILLNAYSGEDLEFHVDMGQTAHARLFFKVRTAENDLSHVDDTAVEANIEAATRGWSTDLRHALIRHYGEAEGLALFRTYDDKFSAGYQELNSVNTAQDDIACLSELNSGTETLRIRLTPHGEHFSLRLYQKGSPIVLADVMPLFRNLGLHVTAEHPYTLHFEQHTVYLHDFTVQLKENQQLDNARAAHLMDVLHTTLNGAMESDSLNNLVLAAGLGVKQLTITRALVAYMQQIAKKYPQDYIRATLVKHATITKIIIDLFEARLNPSMAKKTSAKMEKDSLNAITQLLKQVSVLDEDRILQRLTDVVNAIVRTNAWQHESPTAPLAFKIASGTIPNLIKPHPWREIFVYHKTMEGVHLRNAAVARGGLRWSDRPADFRTEVLGLMKAQVTKNTIIVPTGAKGGFIVKGIATPTRDHAVAAYKTFIHALLSVTDNRKGTASIPPRLVKRLDEDDAYLVVAADKGTATFSDIANTCAQEADYWDSIKTGFWLGDAFASGGSQGYDHKKIGITAKGAWESVKHHFALMGHDTQKQPFSVIGIGDMAGDVFGNGMLLSPYIQLVAAFNHKHIFVDPKPHHEKSFAERQRLFKDIAGWDAYNTKLLSRGGRIYARSSKTLTLTAEIKKRFDISADALTPDELIQHILKARVDLLWNGGIGTFIKASYETHAEVMDRTNDEIRVNAADVRAKVIGEGGNLGLTQAARIEYALNGGRINTDALDNSAGVGTSDREVNIKILLEDDVSKGALSAQKRNTLLASLTPTVSTLILADNIAQNRVITFKMGEGADNIATTYLLQENLSERGLLDAPLEELPSKEVLDQRKRNLQQGYTRPELAVLLAYAKIDIYNALINSTLPEDKALAPLLLAYFPPKLHDTFAHAITKHPLRKAIIATSLTNDLVNRMGLTFLNRMRSETGCGAALVSKAYVLASMLFEADTYWHAVDSLTQFPAAQLEAMQQVKNLVELSTFWLLRNVALERNTITELYARFSERYQRLKPAILTHQSEAISIRKEDLLKQGFSPSHAEFFAPLASLHALPDIATITQTTQRPATCVLPIYYTLYTRLDIDKLVAKAKALPTHTNWERLGALTILDELYTYHKELTLAVLTENSSQPHKLLELWYARQSAALTHYDNLLEDVLKEDTVTHAVLTTVLGQFKSLAHA